MGLVDIGSSRACLPCGTGTVVGWQRPYFVASFVGGHTLRIRAAGLGSALLYDWRSFFDPRSFFYDWTTFKPYLVRGWLRGLHEFLRTEGAAAPPEWTQRLAGGARPSSGWPLETITADPSLSADDFRSLEQAWLRKVFVALAGHSRARRTVRGLANHGLKLLWFLASRGSALPPTCCDFLEYQSFLAAERAALGAIQGARYAILFLCRLNDWPDEPYCSGTALIPLQAVSRLTRHQVKKSAGLRLVYVAGIIEAYCFAREGVPVSEQWEFAIGAGIVVSYCVFARWDDAAQLRWDAGFCTVTDTYIRFYLEHRKNAQHSGNYVDVARRDDGRLGAYDILCRARGLFREGHVLPHISSRGIVDTSRYMRYSSYVRHLRCALTQVGVPGCEARLFAGQSARAGAATEASYNGVHPADLCRMAGVKSINWFLGYARPDQEDRLRASRALGL